MSVPPLPKFLQFAAHPTSNSHSKLHFQKSCPTLPIAMASTKPSKSKKRKSAPTAVGDFTILQMSLPSDRGLPDPYANAKHYLYITTHEPFNATPSDDRSLFIANIPIDASETSLRSLFADQLGGSRVESVNFDASIPAVPTHKRWKEEAPTKGKGGGESKGKKRKREEMADVVAEGVLEDDESALPRIWNGEVRRSGSGAVVVFVDRKSMKGALKEVQRVAREGREVRWSGGEGLGAERKCRSPLHTENYDIWEKKLLTFEHRVQVTPLSPLSTHDGPPIQHQRLSQTIRRNREPAQPPPRTRTLCS